MDIVYGEDVFPTVPLSRLSRGDVFRLPKTKGAVYVLTDMYGAFPDEGGGSGRVTISLKTGSSQVFSNDRQVVRLSAVVHVSGYSSEES